MLRRPYAVVFIVLVALGCVESTGPKVVEVPPDDFVLPEPDLSLDPARIRVGEVIASPCSFSTHGSKLAELRDRHEWATVDIYLWPRPEELDIEAPPTSVLSDADIATLEALGVRVLYRFNVRAVRGRVVLSALADVLLGIERSAVVRDVPDASRFDIPSLWIAFDDVPLGGYPAVIETYGGRINTLIDDFLLAAVALPDQSVPAVRSRPDVGYVEPIGIGCLTSP